MELLDYFLIGICGSLGAFLSGLLGVGGGIIYVPVLTYFLSKSGMQGDMLVKGILANSLFTIIFSGSVSSYKQYKMGNFYPREILLTAIPGMLSALVTTYFIKSGSWYSFTTFNYVFASMLLIITLRMFMAKKPSHNLQPEPEAGSLHYGITGFFAGMVTAFSGLGGGVVMTPVITDILKQSIKKASSVSNGVIPLFAIILGVYNLSDSPSDKISEWQVGYIVFPVIIPMILATFIFAPLGVRMAQKTEQATVRLVFASFVGLVLIKLLYELFIK
ncbi:MAG: sulfite exporter TauE/SafE family protein [Bacteroidota bacterium]|nr:sulfite exporter TauE/SafE family protein [Bacteroidota bacterium]